MKIVDNEFILSPVIFVYPEFGQFDYVQENSEDITIWEIFDEVFSQGLPWDTSGNYKDASVIEFYVWVNLFLIRKIRLNRLLKKKKIGIRKKDI